MRQLLIVTIAIALLGGGAAAAHTRVAADKQNCPSAARADQIRSIESRIEGLEGQLEALDSRLETIDAERRAALDEAKAQIEDAARRQSLSQSELDAAVASALATADARAKSAALVPAG